MLHIAACIAKCLAKAKRPGSGRLMAKTIGGSGAEARLRVAMIHALLTEQLIRVSELCVGRPPCEAFLAHCSASSPLLDWPASCSSCCRPRNAADQVEAERKTKEILSGTPVAIGR
jgi:hypothetical protein